MGIDIKINIDLSPGQKKVARGAVVVGAVIAALGIGVAFAAPIDTTWVASGQPLSASQLKADLDGLQSQVSALAAVPPGTIVSFGGDLTSLPSGWLACDGSAQSRTTYPALFAALGVAWGAGDAITTFQLPDLRGRFLRGVDNGAGNDPDSASRTTSSAGGNSGDKVGTVQADAFAAHTHNFGAGGGGATNTPGYPTSTGGDVFGHSSLPTTSAGASTETRPKNVSVTYIIKY